MSRKQLVIYKLTKLHFVNILDAVLEVSIENIDLFQSDKVEIIKCV